MLKQPSILLINANTVQPPVSPVGLEYVGEAIVSAKILVRILDLAFEPDWQAALANEIRGRDPLAIGLSVRNTDDCCFATKKSFLPWISQLIAEIRRLTQAFVLLGGVGFSIMPEAVLGLTQADAGIVGDGEEVTPTLFTRLMNDEDFYDLPNIVYRREGNVIRNPRANVDLQNFPLPRRRLFDNKRYQQLGAMVGIETKRGCSQRCIFCADPVAKGNMVRVRPPFNVAQEFRELVAQGITWFHLCDSEFNLPLAHAKELCRALVEAGLGDKLRWYCYCSPTPFDAELADLMKRAGCAGINFGVDSLCDEQLKRLGRSHSVSDVRQLAHLLKEERINYMFDLLVGGPGETKETVKATINQAKALDVPLIGIAAGIRIYPETPLSKALAEGSTGEKVVHPEAGRTLPDPIFYLSPHLGSDASALTNELVAGDPRFMFLSAPAEEGSYNYADDDALCQLIKDGARGAYWDILRQSKASK